MNWTARQNRDPHVRAARREGYRARSVYKLAAIDRKYHLIKSDSVIVDLGAAPGGWSQYAAGVVCGAAERVGVTGGAADRVRGTANRVQIIAVDLLEMAAIEKVGCIRGDFTDPAVAGQIFAALDDGQGRRADLVLSDLAPNISGIKDADQARAAALQRAVLAFCRRALKPGGALLIKLFAGADAPAVREELAACFASGRALKPDASRPASKEIYYLGRGYTAADPPPNSRK